MERESYKRVMLYLLGTIALTDYERLTSVERSTFTPKWHGLEVISQLQEEYIADMVKLDWLGEASQ